MPVPNLSFAKIVATPTDKAWSQAYNAGSLFLVASLETDSEEPLNLIEEGKKLLSTIEAEFFGLEEKSLETISKTLTPLLSEIPGGITLSLSLVYVKEDILYCFLKGTGAIILKRGSDKAPLLVGVATESEALISASGRLKATDLLIIETSQFASLITEKTLSQALEYPLPSDIAETISPHVHNSHEGGASSIILSFNGIPRPLPSDEDLSSEPDGGNDEEIPATASETHTLTHSVATPQQVPEHTKPTFVVHNNSPKESFLDKGKKRITLPSFFLNLPRQKQLVLGVVVILLIALVFGIFVTRQSQEEKEQVTLFLEVYPKALKAYEEGEDLLNLNESLAREDFLEADTLLKRAEGKFTVDSENAKKITALQAKIDQQLGSTDSTTSVEATKATTTDTPLLATLVDNPDALSVTENDESYFLLTTDEILSLAKSGTETEPLIENDAAWTKAISIAAFGTNLYVLDQAEGLLKFVPTEEDYASSSYFASDAPNFSKAVSVAIDGSVYLLYSTGQLEKYSRGEKEAFSLTGLDTPFNSPSQIVTSDDMDALYVLDRGNSRIVRLSKDGAVEGVFQATVLKNAKAISISADETTAFILDGNNLYQLPLK